MVARPTVWMEITKSTNDHGGEGWEFGKCLWSPSPPDEVGDRYRVMRKPRLREPVIHCYDGEFQGVSRVKQEWQTVARRPPNPTPWSMSTAFYRIELQGYKAFPKQISRSQFIAEHSQEILSEIESDHPPRYPFIYDTHRITTVQGQFLTIVTERLLGLLLAALDVEESFIFDA